MTDPLRVSELEQDVVALRALLNDEREAHAHTIADRARLATYVDRIRAPTEAMIEAGASVETGHVTMCKDCAVTVYTAMLNAAPK